MGAIVRDRLALSQGGISSKPILVTGAARTGTTWVGRTLALSRSVRYVHEPFSINALPCNCGVSFDYWYYFITKKNEATFREHLRHKIIPSLDRYWFLNLFSEFKVTRRLRTLTKSASDFFSTRSLVKDPLALFSAEWLASVFDMDVVVLIRHPAAFVSSYKQLNWGHPFSHFLDQPLLMKEHLAPFEREIEDFAKNQYGIVDQASLLWKLTHHVIQKYQQTHEKWTFLRYEDISIDPLSEFRKLFRQLDLEFSGRIERKIQEQSHARHIANSLDPYSITRNSEHMVKVWQERLTPQEIEGIRVLVEDLSIAYYSSQSWSIGLEDLAANH